MPPLLRRIVNRIRYWRFADDLEEELALHRELKSRELDGRGVERAMGNELRMRELAREVWVPPSLDALRQDLRDAVRMSVRRPLFTLMSVAALVVGVGAATIAFVLLNSLVLRPLPVANPHELVYLGQPSFSYPILREVRDRSSFFANAFFWNLEQYDVTWGHEPESTLVLQASGSIYETLAVQPFLGRLLGPADEGAAAETAQAVGVLSHGAWQRRFAGNPHVIGQLVRVQGVPISIIGVTPPGFFGVAPGRAPDLTVPVTLAPRLRPDDRALLSEPAYAWLHFMGRLRRGLTRQEVEPEFQVIWSQVLEATTSRSLPPDRRARFLSRPANLLPGATGYSSVRNQFRQPLWILASLAGLLLLVGCATVANMLLAGAWGRSRELAVRLALGCGRARLARQLLIEAACLATLAAAAAVALSRWAGDAFATLLSTTLEPVSLDLAIDWRVAIFTVVIVVITAMACSVASVMVALRLDPLLGLKSGAREAVGEGGWIGRALVTLQVALSVVLLVGAALFLRSLGHLLMLDPGFDSGRLLIVHLDPSQTGALPADERMRQERLDTLYRSVLDSVTRTREVVSASLSLYPPISDEDGAWTERVGIDGEPPVEGGGTTFFNAIAPGYFATLGTPLVAGRDFSWSDREGSGRVAIINETLAAQHFPAQNPVGRRISVGLDPRRQDLTIVGVVGDSKYQRLQETARPIAYLPYRQTRELADGTAPFATVRVASMSNETIATVRGAIAAADPRLTPRLERLSDRIRESLVTERLLVVLAMAVGGCALFLAAAGLFGLLAHLVARRAREIGIRMALGASASAVLRQVLSQALALTITGLVLGIAMAVAGGGWIRSVLHGVTPTDPAAFAAVALTILAVAFGAAFIPARRAASIDPSTALRAE